MVQGQTGLHCELQLDMQRLWLRNLGRDDRLIGEGPDACLKVKDQYVAQHMISFCYQVCF